MAEVIDKTRGRHVEVPDFRDVTPEAAGVAPVRVPLTPDVMIAPGAMGWRPDLPDFRDLTP